MNRLNKIAELYKNDADKLMAKIEAAPNDTEFKTAQDILDTANALVGKFEVHFRDKRKKQTTSNQEIRELFIVMEGKWRELGGTGNFPRPDVPGPWSI